MINSTIGIAGLFDVASKQGIPQHKEDFGQTLGYWGMGDGPYLMLPFFGPSSLRDVTGLATDAYAFDPIMYVDNVPVRNSLIVTKFIDARAEMLPGSDLLDEAALDPYVFTRESFLQWRENLATDGKSQANSSFDDDLDEGDLDASSSTPTTTVSADKKTFIDRKGFAAVSYSFSSTAHSFDETAKEFQQASHKLGRLKK